MNINGLRIYTSLVNGEVRHDLEVFYSRRDNGPFYRWSYEEKRWLAARVSSADFSPKMLNARSWKVVPAALQRSIVEHYQE